MKLNKKAEMFDSVFTILILLIVFFMLQSGVNDLLTGVIGFAPDSTITFLLRLMIPAILIGVIKYTFNLGGSGQ